MYELVLSIFINAIGGEKIDYFSIPNYCSS